MEEKQIWRILGIEATKDENLIKQAYRNKLISVNPEDDPEGFKQLRTAYEEACAYAKKEEPLAQQEEVTVYTQWLEKVREVYFTYSKRINAECWKELLDDDICQDLDTGLEARDTLLGFLMDNFRLTTEVWKLLDDRLSLCAEKEELYEKYPRDFVDFMVNQCSSEGWFDYTLFEGEDDADYDGFIKMYHDIRLKLDKEENENFEREMRDLAGFDIYHPYMDIERVRYYRQKGRYGEAVETARPLVERYPEDTWILFMAAEALWDFNEKEEAFGLYASILEKEPAHYTARLRSAQYHMEQCNYEEAKKFYIDIVGDAPNSQEVLQGLEAVNERLIEQYEKDCREHPKDMELALKLGWCYLQNHLYDRGMKLMQPMTPDEENVAEFHSLSGRLCYYNQAYTDAADHLHHWIDAINAEHPETQEEISQIPVRLGTAYSILCSTYTNMGKEDSSFYAKALDAINHSLDLQEDDMDYLQQKAGLLLEMGEYRDCVDVCDRMVEKDVRYFPAYAFRQEAYYNLRSAQEVIDDFYRALDIYAQYPKMYELAADVFLNYRQYDDVMSILKRAEDNSVSSSELSLIGAKAMRRRAESREDMEKAYEICKKVSEEFKNDKLEPAEVAKAVYEESLCLMALKNYEKALDTIEEAIRLDPSYVSFLWTKADILYRLSRYKEALKLYLTCKKDITDNDGLMEDIGDCYEKLGEQEKALSYYQKCLELNPEHPRVNSDIVDIYDDMLDDTEDIQYFEKALPYADRQIELVPEAYYYIERGLLYMTVGQWENALADFQKAWELEPENTFAYNNAGCVYKYTGQYDKAVELFKKAAEVMKEGETMLPYGNLADCYERMSEYEKAAEAYRKNIELFPEKTANYKDLASVYRMMGRYEEGIKWLEKGRNLKDANELYFLDEIGETYEEMGDYKKAFACFKQALKKDAGYAPVHRVMGEIYLFQKQDLKKALKCFKLALESEKAKNSGYRDDCIFLMNIYGQMKKKAEVKRYYDLALESVKEAYGSVEGYLKSLLHRPARLYNLGCIYYYGGDLEKAEECFNSMDPDEKCRHCTDCQCHEYFQGQGLLCAARGDYRKALEYYERSLKEDPNYIECRARVRDYRKKLKEMRD